MMERMVTANVALDVVAIILSMIPVAYVLADGRHRDRLHRWFLGVAVANIAMIVGDMGDWLLCDTTGPADRTLARVAAALFYVASAAVLWFFARYLDDYLERAGAWRSDRPDRPDLPGRPGPPRLRRAYRTIVTVACAVQTAGALASPLTGWFFTVGDHGYERGRLFAVCQIVPFACYLLFTLAVLAARRSLSGREQAFFLLYVFVPLGCGATQMLLRGIAVVNVGVALALLFILVNIQFEYELALRRRERELAQARADLLAGRIEPHFTYNTLATIAHLCRREPERAQQLIVEFSRFLRANLDGVECGVPIPADRELDHVRHYARLEQERFGERLHVAFDVAFTGFAMPALTVQPIVENAIRHGVLRRREGGTVMVRTWRDDAAGMAVVMVADDGVGMPDGPCASDGGTASDGRAHIGLANVRARLAAMVDGTLDVDSGPDGTVVTIRIPLAGRQPRPSGMP